MPIKPMSLSPVDPGTSEVSVSFSCVKHSMTLAEYVCSQCGHEFCPECVVFPYGTAKPPLCIACALQFAGVGKRSAGRPRLGRRALKRRIKDHQLSPARKRTAPPEDTPVEPSHEEEKWMAGFGEPEDFPGGWKQSY